MVLDMDDGSGGCGCKDLFKAIYLVIEMVFLGLLWQIN